MISFLARVCLFDMRSVLGNTIAQIADMLEMPNDNELLSTYFVKKYVRYAHIPSSEEWQIGLVKDVKQMLTLFPAGSNTTYSTGGGGGAYMPP